MKLGIVLDGRRTASELAGLAKLAETHGLAHLWLSGGARTKDHFLRFSLASHETRRIRLGPIAISPFEMHPVRIALSLFTLDEMSNGRTNIVLGGGGDLATTLGVRLTNRAQSVGETIDVVRKIGKCGEVNFRGEFFQVKGFFSPWKNARVPPLYVGANRPKMIRMAARKADGIVVSDMPPSYVKHLVDKIRGELRDVRRSMGFRISNWFTWNVQETEKKALELARRTLGFRLYYIEDIAESIGLRSNVASELKRRQPEMVRAIFEGGRGYRPRRKITDQLIDDLTITAPTKRIDDCIERLREFERKGLDEMALSLEGDPVPAIKLLGQRVVPALHTRR